MRAQLLTQAGHPLAAADLPEPRPAPGQLLIAVKACAVCRTDLHILDGELPEPKLPLVPGHEIVGTVLEKGADAGRFAIGDRIGVPWLGWTCGICDYCKSGHENLCDHARFTGYQIDGGYAELTVADQRYCFAIPTEFGDIEAAPLLCAGLIGYRTLRLAGDGERIGIYGFARRPISSPRWRATKGGRCSLSPGPAIPRPNTSPARSARSGPAAPTRDRRSRSMRR